MEIDYSNLTSEKLTANEVKKPYKDTIRMFRTLFANDDQEDCEDEE